MKKRILSFVLALLMAVTCFPVKTVKAASSVTYNAEAALNYAKSHYNDGKGKCAEFVADCLRAGGLNVPIMYYDKYTTYTDVLLRWLIDQGYVRTPLIGTSGPKGNWNSFFVSDNVGRISAGDVICYVPLGEQETNSNPAHVVVAGTLSGDRITSYGHNPAWNNTPICKYSDNEKDPNQSGSYGCFVINLSGFSGGTSTMPTASMTPSEYLALSGVTVTPYSCFAKPKNGGSIQAWKLPWTNAKNGVQDAKLKYKTLSSTFKIKNKVVNHAGNVWYEYETGTGTRGFVYGNEITLLPYASGMDAGNISTDTATLYVTWINPDKVKVVKAGFELRNSAGEIVKKATDTVTSGWETKSEIPGTYELKLKYGYALRPNTTYSYSFFYFIEGDDQPYSSGAKGFTTKPVVSTGVAVSPATKTINLGNTLQLTATVSPANTSNKAVTWKSSNTAVATVSSSGVVTAKGIGNATITATATDGSGKSGSATITVSCNHSSTVTLPAVAPTCTSTGLTEGKKCSTCGVVTAAQSVVPATGHTWDAGKVTKEPTEKSEGEKTYTCTLCGGIRTEVIPVQEHVHNYTSVITESSCTKQGYTTHTCACGDSYVDSYTEIVEHNFADGSCTMCGLVGGYCGATFNAGGLKSVTWTFADGVLTVSGTGQMSMPDIGGAPWRDFRENIRSVVIQDGVTNVGHEAFAMCSNLTSVSIPDGVTYFAGGAFLGCTSLVSIDLPDSITGIYQQAFAGCSNLKSIDLPNGITTIYGGTFVACSSLESIQIPDTVTCIEHEAFSGCTSLESITIPDGVTSIGDFAFSDCVGLIAITIPGSVTTIGEYAFNYCPNLVDVYFGGDKAQWSALDYFIPAEYIHYPVTDPVGHWAEVTKNATCEENGYIGTECSCGFVRMETVIPATGHSYEAVVTEPTCTEQGYTTYICHCGDSYIDSIVGARGHAEAIDRGAAPTCTATGLTEGVHCTACGEILVKQETVPAKGHRWDNGKITKEPTEKTEGEKTFTCSNCGRTRTEAIPVLDHVHSYVTIVTAPTCTENGCTVYICRCGDSYMADEVAAKGHTWDAGKVTREPTENNEGEKVFTCTVCGEIRTETIPVLDHVHRYSSVETAPTCKEKGYTTYTCCCGDSYVADEVAALGHAEVIDKAVEATCTETGLTEGKHCSNCDEVLVKQTVVPAKGHSHEAVVTAPTCTEEGYTTHICHCGDSYVDSYTPAKHSYDDRVTITAPTCTEEGYTTYTCRCGDTKTEVIPPVGHTEVIDEAVAPTCTETGLTEGKHCADCGEILAKQDVIPARGHSWDGDTCTVCGEIQTGYRIDLDGADLTDVTHAWVDGKQYPVTFDGTGAFVNIPNDDATNLVIYTFNDPNAADTHTQYPTAMRVWMLDYENGAYTAAYVPEFDNLLQYSGSSIRIVGVKGIRMITSIDKDTRNSLMGGGLAGYTLVEYGTALAWVSDLDENNPLVLGRDYTKSNFAYKRGEADPIFARVGNLIQYTNVLVGFNDDQCIPDIAMRPYIILEDAEGQQITVYGGEVIRSIGYIAWQNRNVFQPGTTSYDYVWGIIHHVYGDQFDEDYKG